MALTEQGYKASQYRLQWVQTTVNYLEHEVSQGTQNSYQNALG